MRLELCQRMDGGFVFFPAFPQHVVQTTYIPPKEASEWRFFSFLAPGWKQVLAGGKKKWNY